MMENIKLCPKCGFRTSIVRAKKKVGKKVVPSDKYFRYCVHIDCDWEEELKPKQEHYLIYNQGLLTKDK